MINSPVVTATAATFNVILAFHGGVTISMCEIVGGVVKDHVKLKIVKFVSGVFVGDSRKFPTIQYIITLQNESFSSLVSVCPVTQNNLIYNIP